MISAFLAAGVMAASASAGALYVERVAFLAADARCGLVSSQVRRAVELGAVQAAGALARAGQADADIAALALSGEAAGRRLSCKDPELARASRAAEAGYQAWSRTFSFLFPAGGWTARRAPDENGWVLWRATGAADRFGLRVWPHGLRLTAEAPDDARMARLVIRQTSGERSEWLAESRAEDRFAFPDESAAALLDARATANVVVEFLGATGVPIARQRIDLGDYAAGVAFLSLGS